MALLPLTPTTAPKISPRLPDPEEQFVPGPGFGPGPGPGPGPPLTSTLFEVTFDSPELSVTVRATPKPPERLNLC